MKKRSGILILGIIIEILLAVASFSYLYSQSGNSLHDINKESISTTFSAFYENSSTGQKIFASSQITLLIIVLILILVLSKKFGTKPKPIIKEYIATTDNKRSRTDLDILYKTLQHKKTMSIEEIEEIFKIEEGVALNWAKILEDGNLAEIHYPRFGSPILEIAKDDTLQTNKQDTGHRENTNTKTITIKKGNSVEAHSEKEPKQIGKIRTLLKSLIKKSNEIKGKKKEE